MLLVRQGQQWPLVRQVRRWLLVVQWPPVQQARRWLPVVRVQQLVVQ
jgi:hypothetical protein